MRKVIPEEARLIPDRAQRVFDGILFDVYQWQQELFDGTHATFEMLTRPDVVTVLAIKDGKLVFQRESQPHYGERYGLPGGRVDSTDESWLAAAKRECAEETGLYFKQWRLVHVVQPQSKIEWFIAVFLAWDVEREEAALHDAGERIEQELLTLEAAKEVAIANPNVAVEYAVYKHAERVEDLLALPEFRGKEVER